MEPILSYKRPLFFRRKTVNLKDLNFLSQSTVRTSKKPRINFDINNVFEKKVIYWTIIIMNDETFEVDGKDISVDLFDEDGRKFSNICC